MNTPEPQHGRSMIDAMREQILATPMPVAARAWSGPRLTRRAGNRLRWALLASGIAVAGLTAALVVTLDAASTPPPAYAATLTPNGTVTITLRELSAIDALNARLAALGTRIRAVRAVHGCDAPVHTVSNGRVVPGPARTLEVVAWPGSIVSMTVEVDTIPGRTLVVAETRSGLAGVVTVVVGPAPRCVGYASGRSSDRFLLIR